MATPVYIISDSEESDYETKTAIPSTSGYVRSALKIGHSDNSIHRLSESDLSGAEDRNSHQLVAKSDERGVAVKKVKLTIKKLENDIYNQKKELDRVHCKLKEWRKKLKCIKPGECLKNITVIIQESLLSNKIFEDVIKTLKAKEIKYETMKTNYSSITWRWDNKISPEFCKNPHLLLIWHHEKFISIARKELVIDYFKQLMKKKSNTRIYLVLYGENGFFRDKRVKEEMEMPLFELQLRTGISHRLFDKSLDVADFIFHMTTSVSLEPYKAELEKLNLEKTFFLQGRSHSCVKVDKQNNGMKKLWIQQIAALHRLPLDSAKIICEIYPTPYSLYQKYYKFFTVKKKKELLQNILVGRGEAKRLGPKMSGKIALLFGNSDGELRLSDWKQ